VIINISNRFIIYYIFHVYLYAHNKIKLKYNEIYPIELIFSLYFEIILISYFMILSIL